MGVNYIGLVIVVIGALFAAMALLKPEHFIVYKMLKAKAACVGEGNEWKWILTYSIMMMIFGALMMFRVFGKQDKED